MKTAFDRSIAHEIINFSMPLVLSGILQQLYSWADAFIIGHAEGDMQLGAIGATSSIFILFGSTILGLTGGLSIMEAQNFGRNDLAKVRKIMFTFLPLLTVLYTAISILAIFKVDSILELMDTPSELFNYSLQYLQIALVGTPFLLVYNMFASLLRAVGNTKVAFYAVLISSIVNVILDILLVVIFPYGVQGAAVATVISQIGMVIFIIIYTIHQYPELLPKKGENIFKGNVFKEGLSFSMPPALQNSITSTGNLILQNFMNGFGAMTVLAVTTAYRVDSIMLIPTINLGAAISSMIARSYGANDMPKVKSYLTTGLILMIILAVILSSAMFLFGAQFVAIFGVTGEALNIGKEFFRDLSLFYTFFSIATVFRSALEGIGDITYCSIIGVGSLVLRIILSYTLKPILAGRTIAFAEGIAWLATMLFIGIRLWCKRKKLGIGIRDNVII